MNGLMVSKTFESKTCDLPVALTKESGGEIFNNSPIHLGTIPPHSNIQHISIKLARIKKKKLFLFKYSSQWNPGFF